MRHIFVAFLLAAFMMVGTGLAEEKKKQQSDGKISTTKSLEVTLKTLPKMRVACIRHIGPYEKVGSAWVKLMKLAGKERLIDQKTMYLGLYYDDPARTPSEKLRCDACITVSKNVAEKGDLKVKEFGGREYAMAVHRGPYENLIRTYKLIFEKGLKKLNRDYSAGPTVEIYKNDHRVTPSKDLITEVYVPIKPQD